MAQASIWAAINQGAASGAFYGGYPFARNAWYVGTNSPFAGRRVGTLAELFAIAVSGDVAYIGPGGYDEGNLVIPERLSNFTLVGTGCRGACFIEPSAAGANGIQVLADDVTFINIGIAGDDTASYALLIGSATISPSRFRAYGCKFEGVEAVNPAANVRLLGCGDIIFNDCEFAWGTNGLLGGSNNNGFPTETYIQNCLFHDMLTVDIGVVVGAHFDGLWIEKNTFALSEGGTPPTDFLLLSDNANIGTITQNNFASATNATGTITIGTGLKYPTNYTEAGPSTARPA